MTTESLVTSEESEPSVEDKGRIPKEYYCTMDKGFFNLSKKNWDSVWLGFAHVFGLQGLYMLFSGHVPYTMWFFVIAFGYFAGIGITVGCHRLWAHKTFKAKLPLRILLAAMQTTAAQYPIFKWCRDHRIHHKYVETDADPHDARRGFWFSHIGWLIMDEHPAVKEKEATIDFTDLDNDPVIRFQTKYYWYLQVLTVFAIPMSLQHAIWPDLPLYKIFCVNYVWLIGSLHFTFLVNSAAHMWGFRPYDKNICPADNPIVSFLAVGEGWHNYHHTFPWDYKAAELGFYKLNWSTMIIDFFALIGWAYDLKTVPEKVVRDRVKRTGDGSHPHHHHEHGKESGLNVSDKILPPWGWGDKDIPEEHYNMTESLRFIKAG